MIRVVGKWNRNNTEIGISNIFYCEFNEPEPLMVFKSFQRVSSFCQDANRCPSPIWMI